MGAQGGRQATVACAALHSGAGKQTLRCNNWEQARPLVRLAPWRCCCRAAPTIKPLLLIVTKQVPEQRVHIPHPPRRPKNVVSIARELFLASSL